MKVKLHVQACTSVCTSEFCSFKVKENNYRGHGDSVDQLCWHPSNPDLFVTASGDKTIRIWDVRTTKCIATVNTKGNFRERSLGWKPCIAFFVTGARHHGLSGWGIYDCLEETRKNRI